MHACLFCMHAFLEINLFFNKNDWTGLYECQAELKMHQLYIWMTRTVIDLFVQINACPIYSNSLGAWQVGNLLPYLENLASNSFTNQDRLMYRGSSSIIIVAVKRHWMGMRKWKVHKMFSSCYGGVLLSLQSWWEGCVKRQKKKIWYINRKWVKDIVWRNFVIEIFVEKQ